jgi:hypothetical protein
LKTKTLHSIARFCPLFASFFLLITGLSAQPGIQNRPGSVRLKNGVINVRRNIADGSLRRDSLQPAHFKRNYYVLVQFDRVPDTSVRAEMAHTGLRLFDYVSDKAWLAEMGDSFSIARLKQFSIGGIAPLSSAVKISRRLQEPTDEDLHDPDKAIAVGYFGTLPPDQVRKEIDATGAVIVPSRLQPPHVFFVRAPSPAVLQHLSVLPFVSYITLQPIQPRTLNYNNRAVHGADALAASRNLYGDGVVVGVGDDTDPYTHVDFTGRQIDRFDAPPGTGHGVHTSGIVGGGGILNPMWQGMAPHSIILSQFFSDILVNTPTYIADYNMPVTSNSYTDYDYGCQYDGLYDPLANYTDAQQTAYPNLTHIFAAGNDGALTCTPFPNQFATVKSGFQSAKNAICVGNIDNTNPYNNNTYSLGTTSSCGPTDDGRIKPDLVAGGSSVISTFPYNTYVQDGGTSMSCPTVAGTIALLVQRYRQQHGGANPPAALLKALVCNTATDLGNPGPDYKYGYGSLDGKAAADAMDAMHYSLGTISDGGTVNSSLAIPAGVVQVRILLYWPDYPAAPYAAAALVNNLDLTVTDPSAGLHHPLILNPDPAHVNDNAVEGVDNVNNIEQVVLNNPSAGTCSIAIHGTSIPQGPQSYVLVYQFIQPAVTLQYPYGKDTWVPGNSEFIRWQATDGSANTFTLDYSADNGATWTVINNAVSAVSRMYAWTTPNIATNQALVRVTRNGTPYSGISTYPFTILGQPAVSVANPCQGYAQLSWSTIPSATSYDILQLQGDTMVKVAGTTATSYLLGSLNRDSSYWLGVRAVFGASSGRRSVSVNITPSGGGCALSALDNDYTADSLIGVHSGRMFTSTQLTSSTPIQVELKNLGTVASGSAFQVSYSINGAPPVTETCSASIPGHSGTYNYTFSTPADFSAPGSYAVQVWVSYPGDPASGNDTIATVVKQLTNDPVVLNPSMTEGFESAAAATYSATTIGFTGLDRCDFLASNANGRARTFVNTGMAHSGQRYAELDQTHYSATFTSDSLITTFNLSSYSSADQIWLDFWYRNQGNITNPGGNAVWIRGNDQAPWIAASLLDTTSANVGIYLPSPHINVTQLLNNASQTVGSSFQIKFGEAGNTSGSDVITDGTLGNGYIFDDIMLTKGTNDIGVLGLVSPSAANLCSLSNSTAIGIGVKNYSHVPATNISVSYAIGGDTVTETIPTIAAGDSVVYTFSRTKDMSAYQTWEISAWVHYPGDSYSLNDTLPPVTLQTSPIIATFPYLEGFDSSNGYWYTGGTNSSWQWGAPKKTIIDRAANGPNCWVTSLTGNYNDNERSYLYSPCFDLSGLTSPVLSFSHIFQTEDDCDCDYHWVEYTTDDVNWTKLGSVAGAVDSGTNWYDNTTRQAWQLSYTKWHVSSYDIPVTAPKVRFRIVMSSDPGTTYEGVGIDDVHVFDKASVYSGADDSVTQSVSGNGWINFDIGGQGHRVAAINPNGQDLGPTTVKVFFNHAAAVRHDSVQYYLDRNIVIQPTNPPASDVGVRYYFLDSEAVKLFNATGCPACRTIGDAYQSGVAQFSSPAAAEEDSSLLNDSTGEFRFHAPHSDVSIIPNDNGYYAEYQVGAFSEFWICDTVPPETATPALTLLSFTATRAGNTALLQWTTSGVFGIDHYAIEKSTDSIHFSPLDSLAAATDGRGTNQYQYTDTHLDTGANYYRIRPVDVFGNFTWSPIRKVEGPDSVNVIIYPNPVHRSFIFISSTTNTRLIRLIDVSGRTVLQRSVRGNLNTVPLDAVATGIYFVEVITDTGTVVQKILVR